MEDVSGKYDDELKAVLKLCGASQGILLIFDGASGPSLCARISEEIVKFVPDVLRGVARRIEESE